MTSPFSRTRVLIVGGGPADSTAAPLLVRDGIEVTLIEREFFPRCQIGESFLPSCLEIADLIGARELVDEQGLQRKPDAYLEWGRESWSLDFGELLDRHTYSFRVERSRFDHLLDGRTSIGAVLHKTTFGRRNKVSSHEEIYQTASSPLLTKVCAPATLVSEVSLKTDYSYAPPRRSAAPASSSAETRRASSTRSSRPGSTWRC